MYVMPQLITSIDDATPLWLTEVFRRGGYLPLGEILNVAVAGIHDEQLHSLGYFLHVTWSANAPQGLPKRLFLKLPRHADFADSPSPGAHEEQMYRRLAPYQAEIPIIPCYDAVYDGEQQRYHLLLADLSETHNQPSWHLQITDRYIEQTIDCLARLHAFWWNRPDLRELAQPPTAAQIENDIQQIQANFARFDDTLSERLDQADRVIFERVAGALPLLLLRRLEPQRPTLVHGDAHFWNFLYPIQGNNLPTYILDWQQHHIDWGVSDIAYTVVLRYPHRTSSNEQQLVKRYHQALLQHGVSDYSWEICWLDYRRAALEQLAVPMLWHASGLPEPLWTLFVPRALSAFRDLVCDEFLP